MASKGCPHCICGVSFGLTHPFFFSQRCLEMMVKSCRAGGPQAHHCPHVPEMSQHLGAEPLSKHTGMLEQQRAVFSAPRVVVGRRHWLNVAVPH